MSTRSRIQRGTALALLLAGVVAAFAIVTRSSFAAMPEAAQVPGETLLIRGGWLFDSVGDGRVRNPGIVVRAGKIFSIGPSDEQVAGFGEIEVVDLDDGATILPGLFDLHAHHAMDLFGRGRIDEVDYNPLIFLANGVTSVFPAGEVDPEKVMAARIAIDNGERPGPRIMNSGPYFGSARPGWNRDATPDQIREEVDYWVSQGAKGFKAKGIGPVHLRTLIEQAHVHGLPVTGHLGSGARNSVNPRDAIMMGIDRIEHFMGGDAMPAERSAYASLVGIGARDAGGTAPDDGSAGGRAPDDGSAADMATASTASSEICDQRALIGRAPPVREDHPTQGDDHQPVQQVLGQGRSGSSA